MQSEEESRVIQARKLGADQLGTNTIGKPGELTVHVGSVFTIEYGLGRDDKVPPLRPLKRQAGPAAERKDDQGAFVLTKKHSDLAPVTPARFLQIYNESKSCPPAGHVLFLAITGTTKERVHFEFEFEDEKQDSHELQVSVQRFPFEIRVDDASTDYAGLTAFALTFGPTRELDFEKERIGAARVNLFDTSDDSYASHARTLRIWSGDATEAPNDAYVLRLVECVPDMTFEDQATRPVDDAGFPSPVSGVAPAPAPAPVESTPDPECAVLAKEETRAPQKPDHGKKVVPTQGLGDAKEISDDADPFGVTRSTPST